MTTVNWTGFNGNWTSGSDWSNGTGPGPNDDAVLPAGLYTVSLTSDITVNSITISGGFPGTPTLQIDNPGGIETIAAGLINAGQIMVDAVNGDLGGTQVDIGGTLTNNGFLEIGNTALGELTTVTAGALVNTGSLRLDGNSSSGTLNQATLDVTAAAPSVWTGTAELSGDALLEFSTGAITQIASGANLALSGEARVALAGNTGSSSALTGLTSNSGTLDLEASAAVTTDTGFVNTGIVGVDIFAIGGSSLNIGGAITNSGTLSIGNGLPMGASTTVTATGLAMPGLIEISGDPNNAFQATLNILGPAPTVWDGLLGLSNDALFEFAAGPGITQIASAASIFIDGSDARLAVASDTTTNSALAGLTSNAGSLVLENGAAVSTTVALDNSGSISLNITSSLSVGGALTNNGTIAAGAGLLSARLSSFITSLTVDGDVSNQGTIDIAGNSFGPNGLDTTDLVIGGVLSGAGTIVVSGGNASVEFGGAVAFTQQITLMPQSGFQQPITALLDDPGQFAATLGGMAVGTSSTIPTDAIDLTGIATSDLFSASLNTSSDVLTVTEIGGATINIQLSGLYTQGTFVDWVADASGNGSDVFLSSQGQAPNGQFVFAATQPVNLALTPDGSNLPPPVNGDFNLEVFTATNGTTAAGYQGSVFAPGGTLASNGDLVAPTLTLNTGDFAVTDLGNHDSITAGNGNETIVGGSFDTITGGNGTLAVTARFNNTIIVGDGETNATVNALAGSDSIALGAGAATVYVAAGDTVNDVGGGSAAVVLSLGESLTIAGKSGGGGGLTLSNESGTMTVSATSEALVAVAGDTIGANVGFATINALRGSALVDANGSTTVFAANGDTVNSGDVGVVTFGSTNLTVSGVATTFPDYTVQGAVGTLVGGADSVNVTGAGGDTISLSLRATATVNALAGNELVDSGNLTTVYGAAGDTINADSSPSATTVVGPSGESLLLTGAAGSTTYTVAGAAGSMSGAAADVNLGLAGTFSDTVTLGAVGAATVNAQFGGEVVNLGSGPSTVFSGQSDTVNVGSGFGTLVALGGEAVTLRGAASSDYTVAGNGASVGGGASSINAIGVAGDTITMLANAATVNALAGSEVVQLGGGNDTAFGAAGDSIGVAPSTSTIAGSQLLLHSDTIPGSAVGFGTFDNLAASSSANVTVGTVSGGNVVGGFNAATDFIFYQNENAGETNTIVMTQSSVTVGGIASTQLALPDGTTMTLVGVNAVTGAMFR